MSRAPLSSCSDMVQPVLVSSASVRSVRAERIGGALFLLLKSRRRLRFPQLPPRLDKQVSKLADHRDRLGECYKQRKDGGEHGG